ncbi:MAG: 2-amino-4-hydroxy-6-hydroxymethyldihydropteridine diphosphokinase [Flavobacteriales bacterium]
MNQKNVTYLSLGSNMGDKKKNIEAAIEYIEVYVGKILQASNFYSSESWGFESDLFLNNAIEVLTKMSPLQLLNKIKIIEQKMGSVHNSFFEGYQPRIIDIDIIYYNDFLYRQKILNIPHLSMHHRKFVLMPLLELCPQKIHPVYNKNVIALLKACNDKNKVSIL